MRNLIIVPIITRDHRSIQKYLSEIKQFPLIDTAEESHLAERIRMGDPRALEKLVCANLRFVVSVAKQYQHSGLALADLISEGNIGLVKAAHRFDDTKGFKFISYAVWWIRKMILQAIAEQGRLVRLPISKVQEITLLLEAINRLEQQLEREPTVEELADHMDKTVAQVKALLRLQGRHTSLQAPLKTDEDNTLLELLADAEVSAPDEGLVNECSRRQEIDRMLARLPKREARIVRLYFGLSPVDDVPIAQQPTTSPAPQRELQLDQIGKVLGLSKERVRTLRNRALLKLSLMQPTENSQ